MKTIFECQTQEDLEKFCSVGWAICQHCAFGPESEQEEFKDRCLEVNIEMINKINRRKKLEKLLS